MADVDMMEIDEATPQVVIDLEKAQETAKTNPCLKT